MRTSEVFKEKDLVLLVGKSCRVVRLERDLNTENGIIKLNDVVGKGPGRVKTHTGHEYAVLKPTVHDFLEYGLKRGPQIITKKDAALILAHTGINKDSVVVDVGTGSGALAIFLGNFVKKVISYEKSKSFYKLARKNVKESRLENVEVLNKEGEGIKERRIDLVTVDVRTPYPVIVKAKEALKPGGYVCVYVPVMEQVKEVRNCLEKNGFLGIRMYESVVREWKLKPIRPKTKMLAHTGFLVFGRKI